MDIKYYIIFVYVRMNKQYTHIKLQIKCKNNDVENICTNSNMDKKCLV